MVATVEQIPISTKRREGRRSTNPLSASSPAAFATVPSRRPVRNVFLPIDRCSLASARGTDGQGNKVSEIVGGVAAKYLVDANNPTGYSQIVEEIVNGAVSRRYTLGHWIISETQNISGTWATSFFGDDGHNSVGFLPTPPTATPATPTPRTDLFAYTG